MRIGTYYRNEFLKNLNIKTNSNEKVLDVGCFDGYWLSTQKAKEKHAIDLDINPIYKAIKYKKGDGNKLPYKNNYFDKVFAFDVIEHVPLGTEKQFISELIRVTKKDGEITLTTPSKYIKIFPRFLTTWMSKRWGHDKCNGYSKNEILNYLNNNKIKDIKFKKINCPYYFNLYFILRMLWVLNTNITKKILAKIAKKDSKIIGENGYLIIKIIK